MRTAITAGAGILLIAAFAGYGPRMLTLAESRHPVGRSASPAGPTPPPDWSREGTFLTASRSYPAVVRLLASGGSPYCSGSVVHSTGGDLVMTAAHCVYASGSYLTGTTVVPGLSGGSRPYGSWQVDHVWIDPRYTAEGHDEDYDYAFLRVGRSDGRAIESAAGADTLTVDQPFHLLGVTTTGYPESGDPGNRQLTCTLPTYQSPAHRAYREMHCGGYTAGVSGAPWVLLSPGSRTGRLVGLIGGFNGGGPPDGTPHEDAISYSPYFDAATEALLRQAESGNGGHDSGS
ncbi:trypsin-like serine peptidase [Streptantibioticus silvisoli]|uniref:trypsin-like serine peptidase n=1 Tax=Streptantibioticus silvisoli TaxID=2705255 RepID=UPI0022FDD77C|nr:trypsin-like serine protease [Streptantibioticus silvisoli]